MDIQGVSKTMKLGCRGECGPEETLHIEQMKNLEAVIGQNMSNVSLPLLLPCHL